MANDIEILAAIDNPMLQRDFDITPADRQRLRRSGLIFKFLGSRGTMAWFPTEAGRRALQAHASETGEKERS